MRDRLPSFVFYPIWWAKHRALCFFAEHKLTEYRQHRLQQLVARERITIALDVGANAGQYAKMLRRIGFKGQIISFEPLRDLARKVAHAGRRDRLWSVQPIALGATRGSLDANVSAMSEFSSLLPASEFGATKFRGQITSTHTETVEVHRLDDLWDTLVTDANARVHLKIDTQGYESLVLEGGVNSLVQVRTLEIELSMRPLYAGQKQWMDLARWLNDAGFQLAGFYPVVRDVDGSVIEADCIFVNSRTPQ